MTYITSIHSIGPDGHRRFVAERLLKLKQRLQQDVSQVSNAGSLKLATWNIMHFGDGGAYTRTTESMLYIAEIIDHFDLVAIQEVNENLEALNTLLRRNLGNDWDYLVTDATGGTKGNSERLAFAYRRSKVWFRKEAGEIVLPTGQEIADPGTEQVGAKVQFARTPFTVSFQSGWFKFKLCTVHIFYGKPGERTPQMEHRRREIEKIAQVLADRQQRQQRVLGDEANYILLGDFNIVSPEHATMQALEAAGFTIPQAIKDAPSSLSGEHHYDQIAFRLADARFRFRASGVFDMFDVIYRDEDVGHYIEVVKPASFELSSNGQPRTALQKASYFRNYYRKHQISDHKLLWCEIKTDFSDDYLQNLQGLP